MEKTSILENVTGLSGKKKDSIFLTSAAERAKMQNFPAPKTRPTAGLFCPGILPGYNLNPMQLSKSIPPRAVSLISEGSCHLSFRKGFRHLFLRQYLRLFRVLGEIRFFRFFQRGSRRAKSIHRVAVKGAGNNNRPDRNVLFGHLILLAPTEY